MTRVWFSAIRPCLVDMLRGLDCFLFPVCAASYDSAPPDIRRKIILPICVCFSPSGADTQRNTDSIGLSPVASRLAGNQATTKQTAPVSSNEAQRNKASTQSWSVKAEASFILRVFVGDADCCLLISREFDDYLTVICWYYCTVSSPRAELHPETVGLLC